MWNEELWEAHHRRALACDPPLNVLQALSENESAEATVIIEAAPPNKIILVNQAWCQLTGYSSEEVVGRGAALMQGPLTCRETLNALKVAMTLSQRLRVMLVLCASAPSE